MNDKAWQDFARWSPESEDLWVASHARPGDQSSSSASEVVIEFRRFLGGTTPLSEDRAELKFGLTAYGDDVLRLRHHAGKDNSPMLDMAPSLQPTPLPVTFATEKNTQPPGCPHARFFQPLPASKRWSELIPPHPALLHASFHLGDISVRLAGLDGFYPGEYRAFSLAFTSAKDSALPRRWFFAFGCEHNEVFCGTGERFSKLDLSGRTILLENADALGVNGQLAYKNVPWVLSSRGYGLFLHTSRRAAFSIADISTSAVQGRVEGEALDLFLVGGGEPERVLYHYRCLTGFPAEPPLWSFGVWMAKMTYFSAAEVGEVARRLRAEDLPCDVLHLDTGWFAKDWVCEWRFSPERFPDPEQFMRGMRERGFRISLWQNPNIGPGNALLEFAQKNAFVPRSGRITAGTSGSDFSLETAYIQLDFSNPEAVAWYQSLLAGLLRMGASVIKTDFGETIDMQAAFQMPPEELHNLYALLYQKAAFEVTQKETGDSIIWARAGWAGCQRYPVHWGGDCAATWEGLAGSIKGGLHLGLSGFAHWSHDVGGFHGVPDFMNSRPEPELYLRWTQCAVFCSHFRYHGTSSREPYEYPEVLPIVRRWLHLRYALIPYLRQQSALCAKSGFPMMRAMPFADPSDPTCWTIHDQFLLGESLLVAPLLHPQGRRSVYLPRGRWLDFWSGTAHEGGRWLHNQQHSLETIPVFLRAGSRLPYYPEPVSHTGEMDLSKVQFLQAGDGFHGLDLPHLPHLPRA